MCVRVLAITLRWLWRPNDDDEYAVHYGLMMIIDDGDWLRSHHHEKYLSPPITKYSPTQCLTTHSKLTVMKEIDDDDDIDDVEDD